MEVNSILIDDTNGVLAGDLLKTNQDSTALSAWFSKEDDRTLKLTPSNIRYNSIPNLNDSTYITFLAYNGTLGYADKVFSSVVVEASGIADVSNPPVLEYNPGEVVMPDMDELDDVVIDIKMYNGTVDVLQYSEGLLDTGEKTYKVKSVRSYPTTITRLPNVQNQRVYVDGWYSYTHVIFRNVEPGDTLIKDSFYGFEGFIFKASVTGALYKDITTAEVKIVQGNEDAADAEVQVSNTNYEEILFSLNETEDLGASGNTVYLHSQILITEEIRDSIVSEVVAASMEACNGCDFADWQKLTMKRAAAAVMFENGLYENSQIIIESSRAMCSSSNNGNC